MNLNSVTLVGRLTKDPEVKELANDNAVVNFSLAINRVYFANKEKKEETTFVDCTAWGNQARVLGKFATKGKEIGVQGRLHLEIFNDKEGNEVRRLRVIADNVSLGNGGSNSSAVGRSEDESAPKGKTAFKPKDNATKPANNEEEVASTPPVRRAF